MRRLLCVLSILAAAVGCSSDDGGGGTDVNMTSASTFDPDQLTISVGETVTWTNGSSQSHTVTAEGGRVVTMGDHEVEKNGVGYFASGGATSEAAARDDLEDGLINEGETFEVIFDEPGTYKYFCIPHESQGMVGTIVVEE